MTMKQIEEWAKQTNAKRDARLERENAELRRAIETIGKQLAEEVARNKKLRAGLTAQRKLFCAEELRVFGRRMYARGIKLMDDEGDNTAPGLFKASMSAMRRASRLTCEARAALAEG